MAVYLTPPPSNLTAKPTQAKSDAELRTIILKGRPGSAMVGFDGAFEEAQLNDLIAYIRSIQS
jgi:mono/diheme cytochrome c family protein